jgi:hypothetical protein
VNGAGAAGPGQAPAATGCPANPAKAATGQALRPRRDRAARDTAAISAAVKHPRDNGPLPLAIQIVSGGNAIRRGVRF